jgi:hypothetical protein
MVGQGRAADRIKGDSDFLVVDRAEGPGNPSCGVQLGAMTLAVLDAEGMAGVAGVPRDGEGGGGIETTRQEDNRGWLRHGRFEAKR